MHPGIKVRAGTGQQKSRDVDNVWWPNLRIVLGTVRGHGQRKFTQRDLGVRQLSESRMIPANAIKCARMSGLVVLGKILRRFPGLLQVDSRVYGLVDALGAVRCIHNDLLSLRLSSA